MMAENNPFYLNPHLDGGTKTHIASPDMGVLLIHGFTATTVEVQNLYTFFVELGYTVSAPLLPGHGTTPEDLNRTVYKEWIDCVDKAYQRLQESCSRVMVAGESMGAVLAMYLAEKYDDMACLMLFSTALLVKRLRFARYLKTFIKFQDKHQADDDPTWQGYSVYPLSAAAEFYKLTKNVLKEVEKIVAPTIMFQGAYDKTIDLENMEFIYTHISSKIKEKHLLYESGHVLLLDQEIELIFSHLRKFLNRHQIDTQIRGL